MQTTRVLFLLSSLFAVEASTLSRYKVVAKRLLDQPIIKNLPGFDFNYNAAVFDEGNGVLGVITRSQRLKNPAVPFEVNPSFLVLNSLSLKNGVPVVNLTSTQIFDWSGDAEKCGTEDPRISQFNDVFYILYTAYDCKAAKLAAIHTAHPTDTKTWMRTGFVEPDRDWSKSGATLFADSTNKFSQHYLFFGDSNISIGIAPKNSFIFADTKANLLETRKDHFDSELVESGPAPLRLATGDYLFIYNSARAGYPSVKPGFELQYNVGYAILSKSDPTQVLERAEDPILSPELEWEIGNTTKFLTPNVVFVEGVIRDPNGCQFADVAGLLGPSYVANAECFFAVYGAADSYTGTAQIIASYT